MLSGAELLKYLNCCNEAKIIEDAVLSTLQCDQVFTPDLGGKCTTEEFVRNVIQRIRDKIKTIYFTSLDDPPSVCNLPEIPTPPYDPAYHSGQLGKEECSEWIVHYQSALLQKLNYFITVSFSKLKVQ